MIGWISNVVLGSKWGLALMLAGGLLLLWLKAKAGIRKEALDEIKRRNLVVREAMAKADAESRRTHVRELLRSGRF